MGKSIVEMVCKTGKVLMKERKSERINTVNHSASACLYKTLKPGTARVSRCSLCTAVIRRLNALID